MRKAIIAGNWKMHKTADETVAFVKQLRSKLESANPSCEVLVGPPFTALQAGCEAADGSIIGVAAQNMYWETSGAFTGEISPGMLTALGCSHVILGHSERRAYFLESDDSVNKKVKAAQENGLIPIVCVGETLEERERGETFDRVGRQISGGLDKVEVTDPERLVIAYEPVWAIGTGKTATPDQAQEVHAFIRELLVRKYGEEGGSGLRILYGGSVKPDNTKGLMSRPDIDGGLVGGASLKVDDFFGIIQEVS